MPVLFEALDRFDAAATLHAAITQEPASLHHVPELADLGERLATKLGDEAFTASTSVGAALDLNEAATHTRAQIELILTELAREGKGSGRPGGLTRREVEVLRLMADGLTTREISTRLFISAKTADHHLQHIYTKLGVSNRATATRWAVEHGLVDGATPN